MNIEEKDGKVALVKVDMGKPELEADNSNHIRAGTR